MMSRWLGTSIVLCFWAWQENWGLETSAAAGNPGLVELTEAERTWLAAHPQVRWGADPYWPPFSELDRAGALVGIDADLTRLVADRVGMGATIENIAVATHVIHVKGLTNLKISGFTPYEFPLHFAIRKDAPELRSILNKGLATITDREREMIYAAHLTPDMTRARNGGLWQRRSFYGTVIGVPLFGLVVFWNWYLARQIRRRKMADAALSDTRDRLQRRTEQLDSRVREVERLNAELQLANQDLESFSSSASHDLRAPLRRTMSFAGLLQVEAKPQLTNEAQRWLEVIIKEMERMDRLIQDLLRFARLGRAGLIRQAVDMTEMVRSIMLDTKPQLKHRNVTWAVGDLCVVDGDPALLRQALANLIDNALKYTRRMEEGRIEVGTLAGGSSEREAVFYVRDNGCGFDMDDAKALFRPFQRLHGSGEYEGTGVGLASVARIIEKHGGRIWFESKPNEGAIFFFTLTRV